MDKEKFQEVFSKSISEVITGNEEPIDDIIDNLKELIHPDGKEMNYEESLEFDEKASNIIQTIVSLSVSSVMNFNKQMELEKLKEKLPSKSENGDSQAPSLHVLKDLD